MSFQTVYDFSLGIGTGFGIAAVWVLSSYFRMAEDCVHKNCPHHKRLDKRTK